MKRPDFLEVFARHRGDIPTITGPGLMTRELFAVTGDDPTILYNMEMPYATPMCLGLAMARPNQRFVALEGDGSLIMALGVLTTIARYRPSNLTVIVLDNEIVLDLRGGHDLGHRDRPRSRGRVPRLRPRQDHQRDHAGANRDGDAQGPA